MLRIAVFVMTFLAVLVFGLKAPIPGYAVEEITWEVQAFADGAKVSLTGTVEQVYDKLIKINPDFSFNDINVTDTATKLGAAENRVSCGNNGHPDWVGANELAILWGITYLQNLAGQPSNGPGPGACGRVSCSWKSAIWWCNDNDHTYTLGSWSDIAQCANEIRDTCWPGPYGDSEGTDDTHLVGINFQEGGWNCIVRRDEDNC
ncbi:hypothetical protein B0H66DRAFT_592148 [Apodospora peruviana]|uniref:Uncharacterized protein n=1 Tax=Apodospora peruviana TaxID=516989 RepID=A0AAE0HZT9_9PEZI|nr:hypothetical protein B0H66DRAFT_592148 [Apodospora peruviana]